MVNRRGFLRGLLGLSMAAVLAKADWRVTTKTEEKESSRGLPRLDMVCSGPDGELLYLFPDGEWKEATGEEIMEAAIRCQMAFREVSVSATGAAKGFSRLAEDFELMQALWG